MATCDVQKPVPHTFDTFPRSQELPILRSNQGNNVPASSTGWLHPVARDTPAEELRARFESDGYLWVKNVLPREDVLDMREHYFRQLSATGMLLPSSSPRDGIFDPAKDPLAFQGLGGDPGQQTCELLDKAHTDPTYRKFLAHPALREFIRDFMGWEKEVLIERALLRHNCPGSHSSPVHYDQMFLRAGEPKFLTAWLSIGDTAANGGGLMYLENSSQLGEEIEAEFARNAVTLSPEERIRVFNKHMAKDGYLTHDAEEFGRVRGEGKMKWLVGDYEAGDVLFHKPYMVHAAAQNQDQQGRIRLSSDLRFYEEGVKFDERWDNIFTHDDGLS